MDEASEILRLWRAFSHSLLPMAQSAIAGEASILPGGTLVMTGVPDVDLNWAFLYGPEEPEATLTTFLGHLRERRLPATFIAASPLGPRLGRAAADLGLRSADRKPLMLTHRKVVLPSHPSGLGFTIERLRDEEAFAEALTVAGEAWATPAEVMARIYRPAILELVGVEAYVARLEGEMVSYVSSVPVGHVVWLGDLGTVPAHRRKGAAASLLVAVMESYRQRGWRVFGLGAEPDAVGLYERLGFETRDRAPIWVSSSE